MTVNGKMIMFVGAVPESKVLPEVPRSLLGTGNMVVEDL
jgi:hypothetical protein